MRNCFPTGAFDPPPVLLPQTGDECLALAFKHLYRVQRRRFLGENDKQALDELFDALAEYFQTQKDLKRRDLPTDPREIFEALTRRGERVIQISLGRELLWGLSRGECDALLVSELVCEACGVAGSRKTKDRIQMKIPLGLMAQVAQSLLSPYDAGLQKAVFCGLFQAAEEGKVFESLPFECGVDGRLWLLPSSQPSAVEEKQVLKKMNLKRGAVEKLLRVSSFFRRHLSQNSLSASVQDVRELNLVEVPACQLFCSAPTTQNLQGAVESLLEDFLYSSAPVDDGAGLRRVDFFSVLSGLERRFGAPCFDSVPEMCVFGIAGDSQRGAAPQTPVLENLMAEADRNTELVALLVQAYAADFEHSLAARLRALLADQGVDLIGPAAKQRAFAALQSIGSLGSRECYLRFLEEIQSSRVPLHVRHSGRALRESVLTPEGLGEMAREIFGVQSEQKERQETALIQADHLLALMAAFLHPEELPLLQRWILSSLPYALPQLESQGGTLPSFHEICSALASLQNPSQISALDAENARSLASALLRDGSPPQGAAAAKGVRVASARDFYAKHASKWAQRGRSVQPTQGAPEYMQFQGRLNPHFSCFLLCLAALGSGVSDLPWLSAGVPGLRVVATPTEPPFVPQKEIEMQTDGVAQLERSIQTVAEWPAMRDVKAMDVGNDRANDDAPCVQMQAPMQFDIIALQTKAEEIARYSEALLQENAAMRERLSALEAQKPSFQREEYTRQAEVFRQQERSISEMQALQMQIRQLRDENGELRARAGIAERRAWAQREENAQLQEKIAEIALGGVGRTGFF